MTDIAYSLELDDEGTTGGMVARDGGKQIGFLEIRPGGVDAEGHAAWLLPHTETDEAYEGKGIASSMARQVLDEARERGLRIRPLCPYVKGWIARHEDYVDLIAR